MSKTMFINWKGRDGRGRETIDEVRHEDFPELSLREFRVVCRRLVEQYTMMGQVGAYISSRCCSNWKG